MKNIILIIKCFITDIYKIFFILMKCTLDKGFQIYCLIKKIIHFNKFNQFKTNIPYILFTVKNQKIKSNRAFHLCLSSQSEINWTQLVFHLKWKFLSLVSKPFPLKYIKFMVWISSNTMIYQHKFTITNDYCWMVCRYSCRTRIRQLLYE